jgi:decaprenylphospho-beta-D-ribofuranose 2-oxidase
MESLMSSYKKNISGWGNYPISSAYLTRPERYQQLKVAEGKTIARGLGRSYGDAALNTDQHVILMERLNRFLSFDENRGLLQAEAGATLEEILQVFIPRGWFLPVTPGTKFVTLGGCVAADIHGKNHHVDGTFGNHVREMELILADGSHRRCSPIHDAGLFWGTVGGMGLTGIISEVTLQLIPIESAYMAVTHRMAHDLEDALDLLGDKMLDDKYSVAWIDCLATGKDFGRSIIMTAHHALLDEISPKIRNPLQIKAPKTLSLPFFAPSWVLNSWSLRAFNSCYYKLQGRKIVPFVTDYESYFYPLDKVVGWNRMYGKRGFVQYQFVVPLNNAHRALHLILEKLVSSQRTSFLAVLKRFGEEGPGFLSFPREGYTLALDIPVDPELFPFLDQMDEIVLNHEGRIYLAKDARMKPERFRAMYSRFPQWQQIKDSVDPDNHFSSDLSRRLQMESKPLETKP